MFVVPRLTFLALVLKPSDSADHGSLRWMNVFLWLSLVLLLLILNSFGMHCFMPKRSGTGTCPKPLYGPHADGSDCTAGPAELGCHEHTQYLRHSQISRRRRLFLRWVIYQRFRNRFCHIFLKTLLCSTSLVQALLAGLVWPRWVVRCRLLVVLRLRKLRLFVDVLLGRNLLPAVVE